MISSRQNEHLSGFALTGWLIAQIAALGAAAARVPVWARAPAAGEELALFYMLAVQTATVSFLFPILLIDFRWTLLAIVTAWPMAQLAGYLSDSSALPLVLGELYVSAWIVALSLWSPMLHTKWLQLLGAALASMIALGGPILLYLRLEFGGGAIESTALFGPICGALSQIIPDASKSAWMIPATPIILAAIIFWKSKWRSRSRQVIH